MAFSDETRDRVRDLLLGKVRDKLRNYSPETGSMPFHDRLMSAFRDMKRQLLQWVAIRASLAREANIRTLIAIPYNPYDPEPYERWTGKGLFDYEKELLVGKDFWDFLGGEGAYERLLAVFAEVGQTVAASLKEMIESI